MDISSQSNVVTSAFSTEETTSSNTNEELTTRANTNVPTTRTNTNEVPTISTTTDDKPTTINYPSLLPTTKEKPTVEPYFPSSVSAVTLNLGTDMPTASNVTKDPTTNLPTTKEAHDDDVTLDPDLSKEDVPVINSRVISALIHLDGDDSQVGNHGNTEQLLGDNEVHFTLQHTNVRALSVRSILPFH